MPRYPGVTWKPSPNHTPGNHGRKAVVLHIAQGGYTSSITHMAANGVSSHFIVSAAGSVSQMVDIADTAWANGLAWCDTPAEAAALGAAWQGVGWYCPHKHKVTPSWADITPGVNPNLETISIEHEGMSGRALPAGMFQRATGIDHTIVNGVPFLDHGEHVVGLAAAFVMGAFAQADTTEVRAEGTVAHGDEGARQRRVEQFVVLDGARSVDDGGDGGHVPVRQVTQSLGAADAR